MKTNQSLFTKIINREIPAEIITENEDLIVIKDIAPQAPIHFLIIPKKPFINITDMVEDDFAVYPKLIFEMAYYLSKNIEGAQQFKLLMNNGHSAGQRVFHAHVHFLAGY
jgi:histidine triad (HIT) family protein